MATTLFDYHLLMKLNPIITRFKICKLYFVNNYKISYIAKITNSHRNTISNIINTFKQKADDIHHQLLSSNPSFDDIISNFSFLAPKSRKPHSNKRSSSYKASKFIIYLFLSTNFWYKKTFLFLKRKYPYVLQHFNLTLSKIKWIYRNYNLKVRKVKSKSKRNRPLFDYKSLAVFEYLFYDTKHILDKKALPSSVYNKFNLYPELPIYEYNIFDAKSWFRFIAYANSINATFGLYFLKFVIMFIRSIWYDLSIKVYFDWWIEFVSNSDSKLKQWNDLFSLLNTTCFLYDWPRDPRKNLIERSHRIDDEEFLIPRWDFINSKQSFLTEAKDYWYYYNFERVSSSKYRYWKTPYDIISSSWLYFHRYLLNFPTLILDDCIWDLIYHTKTIDTIYNLKTNPPDFSDSKSITDFKYKFNIHNNIFAQNVFDPYLLIKILSQIDFLTKKITKKCWN